MSRRPTGYGIIVDPSAPRAVEMDSFTCCHCNRVQFIHNVDGTRKQEAAMCIRCMKSVCDACDKDGRCIPFEKKLAEMEGRERLFSVLGE